MRWRSILFERDFRWTMRTSFIVRVVLDDQFSIERHACAYCIVQYAEPGSTSFVDIVCEAYELRRRVREREPLSPRHRRRRCDGRDRDRACATPDAGRSAGGAGIVHRWLFVLKPVDQYI